ncbi:leucyl aminopeptidase [Pseudomarimonas salicorniae]|uniref:Probable cytosol aminopeptidase n=1 Tax=Pseudomarimonas salicorniae TaxID=2933270 RepID=A0ABT0GE50_9GAMM|nr:leucyl aminopeptidase [Lysobacter sp. CAU 1642]MCK7592825.1 leucyl aminopeptidase [Lysobacter sp. CAU 1642]
MNLNYRLLDHDPAQLDVDCIVVAVFADGSLSPAAQALDAASGGALRGWIESGDVQGKAGKCALLRGLPGVAARRVLVAGAGPAGEVAPRTFLKLCAESAKLLAQGTARSIHVTLHELSIAGRDADWALHQALLAFDHAAYRYTTTRKPRSDAGYHSVSFAGSDAATAVLQRAQGIAEGVAFARELGNLPPNICNPAYVADKAREFAAAHEGLRCEVLEREQMEALGMGSLLAVARGSANAPRLIVLEYRNGGEAKPLVLVGKGITFDSGGLNLKVQGGIEEMKFDMCGAASVFGSFVAAVKAKLPVNLVVVIAAVENMPDGNSYRPSDVLTSMSGKTIEVLNTDAEGRLILCDALTYAQRFEPAALIDVATLTGACVIALGKHAHGLMTKHDDLAAELLAAGEHSGDRAWRLPIWDEYQVQLDSAFADVANIGGKSAGAITAGCFLSRFTEGQRWAHLDIAGTSWDEGRKGLANGRPVGMLAQWMVDRAS